MLKEICVSGNMFSVFDHRQAIYSFRGGNPEYCMNFDKEWDNATIINLDTNYRSAKKIVSKANDFIRQYYGQYKYHSDSIAHSSNEGQVSIHTYDDREIEGRKIADEIQQLINKGEKLKDIFVLYRLNAHSINIEHELMKRGIDYDITSDGSFFKRKEIAGILAYLKLVINPHDDGAMTEIFKLRNNPFNFFSGKLIDDIKRFAGAHNLSIYESLFEVRYEKDWQSKNAEIFTDTITRLRLQKDKEISTYDLLGNIIKSFQMHKYIEEKYSNPEDKKDRLESLDTLKSFVRSETPEKFLKYIGTAKKKAKENSVKLMSVHASKGLEAKNVLVIGVSDGKFPHDRSDLNDEARLFYVAVTRPQENLVVSQIGNDNKFIMKYM
jgi:DNA helicase-2/ATP-dependent DNA helicase PcrA